MNDAVVNRMLHMNMPLEAIILQLTKDKKAFVDHIVKLENIRPRVIKLPDGRKMVWRCPDEYIPEE